MFDIRSEYANPVAIVDTTQPAGITDASTSGPAVQADATPWGAPPFLSTGTIVLIMLALAAVGGIAWYYFKKR